MNQETITQLAELAQESNMAMDVDWQGMNISKDEIFKHMASNVLQQLETVSENERAVVAMATMTKLLVENFIYNAMLQGNQSG
jgi:hypothetical protein|tara:strand:+ start:246 stop:494 length:249 start_codon:yes stop_codon:yes gene_type:complete